MSRVHGADVLDSAEKTGISESDITDFSSNVNIFLPDLDYHKIFLQAKKRLSLYPDMSYRKLRQSAASHYSVKKEHIVPGNGASELIYLINRLPEFLSIGIVDPTFCEYERAARIAGKTVIHFSFEEIDGIIRGELPEEKKFPDLLIICNPNNPTAEIRSLEKLLEICGQRGAHLLVDETFLDFQRNEVFSLMPRIEDSQNLSLLKALTKYPAMTGLRLGFLLSSNRAMISQLWEYKEPWSVNCLAEQAAIELFDERGRSHLEIFRKKTQSYYEEESRRLRLLYGRIEQVKKISEGRANYLLLEFEKGISSESMKTFLLQQKGFLVRSCTDFRGLDERYLRIAVKERPKNDALFEAIKEYLHLRGLHI